MTRLIYLEWWDAVEQGGATRCTDNPDAVLLKGYTTLLEETEQGVVVAHFTGENKAGMVYFDRLAIPRPSIKKMAACEVCVIQPLITDLPSHCRPGGGD